MTRVVFPAAQVETADSSVLAQLGWPDMRLPILYTMSWPQRVECSEVTWPRLDFVKMGDLTFKEPDVEKYPSLTMVGEGGGGGNGLRCEPRTRHDPPRPETRLWLQIEPVEKKTKRKNKKKGNVLLEYNHRKNGVRMIKTNTCPPRE